jgi:hypothetical protein
MSVGTTIALLVLLEAVALLGAVRWLMSGLRSAECHDWPPIRPLAPSSAVPGPRDAPTTGEKIAAAS